MDGAFLFWFVKREMIRCVAGAVEFCGCSIPNTICNCTCLLVSIIGVSFSCLSFLLFLMALTFPSSEMGISLVFGPHTFPAYMIMHRMDLGPSDLWKIVSWKYFSF